MGATSGRRGLRPVCQQRPALLGSRYPFALDSGNPDPPGQPEPARRVRGRRA
jgi:hypothetical protein